MAIFVYLFVTLKMVLKLFLLAIFVYLFVTLKMVLKLFLPFDPYIKSLNIYYK
jgi:hypothetical protein